MGTKIQADESATVVEVFPSIIGHLPGYQEVIYMCYTPILFCVILIFKIGCFLVIVLKYGKGHYIAHFSVVFELHWVYVFYWDVY